MPFSARLWYLGINFSLLVLNRPINPAIPAIPNITTNAPPLPVDSPLEYDDEYDVPERLFVSWSLLPELIPKLLSELLSEPSVVLGDKVPPLLPSPFP